VNYRYNALDIAAYFKWTSLPPDTEEAYFTFLYSLKETLLARPFTKDFEEFRQTVFREMYHVWARGFENEFSDVNRIAREDALSIFCDREFHALESYMKLLGLHLIFSSRLPYIRIHLIGLTLILGLEGSWEEYRRNLNRAADALGLFITDEKGRALNEMQEVPHGPIRITLMPSFRLLLFGENEDGVRFINDYQEKMQKLREKSHLQKKKLEAHKEKPKERRKRKQR